MSTPRKSVLLLIDIQPDFMPGGPLAVAGGNEILEPVQALMDSGAHDLIAATQDWHPPGHASFASSHPGQQPFDCIEWHGHEQVLWPDHCIQGSAGAALHPALDWRKVAVIVRKGMDPEVDSYSGFRNNWNAAGERPPTGLAGYLRERGIESVTCCGLARDVCAKWTAEDAAALGFDTRFRWDLSRSVDPSQDEAVRADLESAGVQIVTAD